MPFGNLHLFSFGGKRDVYRLRSSEQDLKIKANFLIPIFRE
jgi:hypothetical protein